MARRELEKWWEPKPLTEEQMQMEIGMSRITPKSPSAEFSDKDIKDTLKALNLGNRYDGSDDS